MKKYLLLCSVLFGAALHAAELPQPFDFESLKGKGPAIQQQVLYNFLNELPKEMQPTLYFSSNTDPMYLKVFVSEANARIKHQQELQQQHLDFLQKVQKASQIPEVRYQYICTFQGQDYNLVIRGSQSTPTQPFMPMSIKVINPNPISDPDEILSAHRYQGYKEENKVDPSSQTLYLDVMLIFQKVLRQHIQIEEEITDKLPELLKEYEIETKEIIAPTKQKD